MNLPFFSTAPSTVPLVSEFDTETDPTDALLEMFRLLLLKFCVVAFIAVEAMVELALPGVMLELSFFFGFEGKTA